MKLFLLVTILMFILNITANSQFYSWAEKISGLSYDDIRSIAVDDIGNIYVAGISESSNLDFNNNITLISNEIYHHDAFIAKYNNLGICQWAQKITGMMPSLI